MYTCNTCGKDYPYLIFEYNTLACENCSIRKNISNCHELDMIPVEWEEEVEWVEVNDEDAEQLVGLINQISNPEIRADFSRLANEYIHGIENTEES